MISKILCFLGLHKWPKNYSSQQTCLRCPEERTVIWMIHEDTARELGASEEAIARGKISKKDLK